MVSFADAALGGLSWRDAAAYLPAQVAGCVTGAAGANLMFAEAAVSVSVKHRASGAHALSEVIATAGLVLVIFALARSGRLAAAPAAVGAYIGAAYWFTASTSFANPAITVGRMFSDSFAGIAPSSVLVFIAAQIGGGVAGVAIVRVLYPSLSPAQAASVIVPHETAGRLAAPHGAAGLARDQQVTPNGREPLCILSPSGQRRGHQRRAARPGSGPGCGSHGDGRGRLPELLHRRHPLLRLR